MKNPLLIHNNNTFLIDTYRNEKFDDRIVDFIFDVLLEEEFDCLLIPYSLSENYIEFVGLELAFHIRLTEELRDLRFVPIVFFGAETPYLINKLNNLGQILFTDGIYVTKEEQLGKILEKEIKGTTKEKICVQIEVPSPSNYSSHHSVANEWSILRWAKYLGINKRDDFKHLIEKIDSSLYYKYLLNKYPTPQIEKGEIGINGNGKVLLIDDEYQKGWKIIFKEVFKSDDIEFKTLEMDFEKSKDEIVDSAINKIELFEPDLVILDFRLHNSEFYNTEIKDFISIDILRKIKMLNKGIQVIIFTASNKVWNLQDLEKYGADGFIIKESPEFNRDNKFTRKNFEVFKRTVEKSLQRKYLKQIAKNIKRIKSSFNDKKIEFLKKDDIPHFIKEIKFWLDNGFNIILKDDSQKLKNSAYIYFYHVFETINTYQQEQSSNISISIQRLSNDQNDTFSIIKRKRKRIIHGQSKENINEIALLEIIEFIKTLFCEGSK